MTLSGVWCIPQVAFPAAPRRWRGRCGRAEHFGDAMPAPKVTEGFPDLTRPGPRLQLPFRVCPGTAYGYPVTVLEYDGSVTIPDGRGGTEVRTIGYRRSVIDGASDPLGSAILRTLEQCFALAGERDALAAELERVRTDGIVLRGEVERLTAELRRAGVASPKRGAGHDTTGVEAKRRGADPGI